VSASISNVVLNGDGRAALNFDNTVSALKLMIDEDAYGLSRRRVTLSTSGIVPMIDRLGEECPWHSRCRCTRRTTRFATSSCPSIASTRSPNLLAACGR